MLWGDERESGGRRTKKRVEVAHGLVVLVAVVLLGLVRRGEAVTTCKCSCCVPDELEPSKFFCIANKTFEVGHCADCLWSECARKYPECVSDANVVEPLCIKTSHAVWERIGAYTTTVLITFLALVSVARYYVTQVDLFWRQSF